MDDSRTTQAQHDERVRAGESPDEDIALGCECAYPALQIERWPGDQPQWMPSPEPR